MALPADQKELLRRQHGFAEWQGLAEQDDGPPVRGFRFAGDELPGWQLVKSRRNDAAEPPRLDTFWRPHGETGDALLGVRVIETASVPAAREALLEALGDFQSAAIRRRTDLDLGEVAFGQEFILLFARRNLVVFVRNAGRQVVEVLAPARALDAHLAKLLTR